MRLSLCKSLDIIYGLSVQFGTQDTLCHDYGVISPLVNESCQSLSSRQKLKAVLSRKEWRDTWDDRNDPEKHPAVF